MMINGALEMTGGGGWSEVGESYWNYLGYGLEGLKSAVSVLLQRLEPYTSRMQLCFLPLLFTGLV